MSLFETTEGRTRTRILASIAEYQFRKESLPRQKDIVETLPYSKGTISNNCKRLETSEMILEEENRYKINMDKLLTGYREHIERYLNRERKGRSFKKSTEKHNEIRTKVKKQLRDKFENKQFKKVIKDILVGSLVNSINDGKFQTLREIFFKSDQLLKKVSQIAANGGQGEHMKFLIMLSIAMNHTHEELENFSNNSEFLEDISDYKTVEDDLIKNLEDKK